MPENIYEQMLSELNGTPTPQPPPALPTGGGNIYEQMLSELNGTPTPQPQADPVADETESWWSQHGKTAELAAGAGLALIFGPKALRLATRGAEKMGVLGEAAARVPRTAQAILAPATVDEPSQAAAGLIRAHSGEAARATAQTEATMLPEWQKIGNASDVEKLQFIDYVQGRSKGAKMARPELQSLADNMRTAYKDVHEDLGTLTATEKTGFIEDYYRHHWVTDEKSNGLFSKQGLASFTKERKIPTIREGIEKYGLTPKTLDPVQTTMEYVDNARRFIAAKKTVEIGKQQGYIVQRQIGSKKPLPDTYENWVPLEGANGKRGPNQLYAPEGFARVYNNWVTPGFQGAAGDVMNTLRRTSNSVTALELGLSGFHATTMINEAVVNDVAKAIQQIAGGDIPSAIKSLVMAPTAPYRLARTGGKLQKVYLGTERGTKEMRQIVDLLEQAGGRTTVRHSKEYEFTSAGSFLDAWKRGALRAQAIERARDMAKDPIFGTIRTVGTVIGKTIQQVSEPIFKYYIPKLKTGAFSDTMATWLKANPNAGREEQVKAARDIWDSIDNRFGEMVQDNIFWKQHMKQVAMLGMRSYSWTMGSVREIGGGVKDMTMHQFTPRAAYAIALPVVYGTIGAMYQYMKTGEAPQDVNDLVSPRTGGTDPATGLPERMIMPGYIKDVIGWTDHPTEELMNKLSTGVRLPFDLLRNKDWRGSPIAPPTDSTSPYEQSVPVWLKAYLQYVGEAMTPISVKNSPFFGLGQPPKEGTGLSSAEQFMGMQPAGRKFTDPEGTKAMKTYFETKEWRKKVRYDERQKSLRQGYGGVE